MRPRGDRVAPTRSPNALSPGVFNANLAVIFSITLTAVMGVASITPAIPTIAHDLAVAPTQIGLLITIFTLPGVFLTPVLGVLGDRWGRKQVLVPSLVLFAVAGGLCPLAGDFTTLLAFRFVQGTGAAALGSLNVTLIGDLYEGRRRVAAMGYNASVLSLGTASYPALGGLLTGFGWQYPFVLPWLAIPVALAALRVLPESEMHGQQGFGAYLRSTLVAMRRRRLLGLLGASVVTFVILYGAYLTYIPVLMRARLGSPPVVIGLLMSSASLTTAVVSSQLGRISAVVSGPRLVTVAFLLYAVSLAVVPTATSLWGLVPAALIFGAAQGINIPSIMSLLASAAPTEQRAAFMALNGMVLRIGQTLGPVLMGGAFAAWGLDAPFHAGIGLALTTFFVLAWALR